LERKKQEEEEEEEEEITIYLQLPKTD